MRSLLMKPGNRRFLFPFLLLIFRWILPLSLAVVSPGCTDIEGDGADSLFWEGITLPDQSSFRNPIWEPDLSNPSVFRGATQFFAFGDEKEWSPDLRYNVPVIRSGNLMNWSFAGQAFTTKPSWAEGNITNVSGIFAKTLSTYYLAYEIAGKGIGVAWSKTPQGPFTDYGRIIDPATLGFVYCKDPHFMMSGVKFYMFFETPDGIYGTELNVIKNNPPSLRGNLFKIAGTGWTGVYIYRKASDLYYFLGTAASGENSSIRLAKASIITGPYLDKSGTNILNGGGTDLVVGGTSGGFINPSSAGGIFSDFEGKDWIIYQVTDIKTPLLSTGEERHPIMLSRIEWDSDGWPVTIIEAKGGWHQPKFRLSN